MGDETGPVALGTQIGEARRAKGMTQQQLADAVGVERKTVNRWEAGRTNGLGANYAKLAETLGWPPGQALRMVQGEPVKLDEPDPEDPTLNPVSPLDAKLIVLRIHDAELPAEDRARLLANLTVLLEWTQSRIDAAKTLEERAEELRTLTDLAGMRPVRERHDAGR